jgi:hypothetical protein
MGGGRKLHGGGEGEWQAGSFGLAAEFERWLLSTSPPYFFVQYARS